MGRYRLAVQARIVGLSEGYCRRLMATLVYDRTILGSTSSTATMQQRLDGDIEAQAT